MKVTVSPSGSLTCSTFLCVETMVENTNNTKCYGIWIGGNVQDWLGFQTGEIFWTVSLAVANAQLKRIVAANPENANFQVRSFEAGDELSEKAKSPPPPNLSKLPPSQ